MTTMTDYAALNGQRYLLGPGDKLYSNDGQYSAYIWKGGKKGGLFIQKKGSSATKVMTYKRNTCSRCYGYLRVSEQRNRFELWQARSRNEVAKQTFEDWVTPNAVGAAGSPQGGAYYLILKSFSDGACLILTDCSGRAYQAMGTSKQCLTLTSAKITADAKRTDLCHTFGKYGGCGKPYCVTDHRTAFTLASFNPSDRLTFDDEYEDNNGNDTMVNALLISGALVFALLMMVIGCLIYRRRRKAKKVFMEEVADEEDVVDAEDDAVETMVETEMAKNDEEQEQITAN